MVGQQEGEQGRERERRCTGTCDPDGNEVGFGDVHEERRVIISVLGKGWNKQCQIFHAILPKKVRHKLHGTHPVRERADRR